MTFLPLTISTFVTLVKSFITGPYPFSIATKLYNFFPWEIFKYLVCFRWIGRLEYASFRSTEAMKPLGIITSNTCTDDSILNLLWCEMNI